MLKFGFISRLLPESAASNTALYNLLAVAICLAAAALLLIPLVFAAIVLAYVVSEKLKAGLAGVSIILLFTAGAVILDLAVLFLLIAANIRWK